MSQSPIDRLMRLGDPRGQAGWPAYKSLGLTDEHVPDLIRIATDEALHNADSNSREVWAPMHAWRALGQLCAEPAIEPLLSLLHRIDDEDDDWAGEELPKIFGLIGPAAIPTLAAYLADSSHGLYARTATSRGLEAIGNRHPPARAECVAALSRQLERFEDNAPELNGFIIGHLLDLDAVEAAPLIERAFAARRVDVTIAGDWDDVKDELGLE